VRVLANPMFLRAAVVLICSASAFLMTLLFMRRLRQSISDEADVSSDASPSLETLPLHLYNTVIQQLKQQKHELDVRSQAEQQRARMSETFSQAVLSNLSSGVLVFGTNGLVKSSNPAAKEILGFALTSGMSAADIFRDATIRQDKTPSTFAGKATDQPTRAEITDGLVPLAAEVDAVLREGSQRRQVEAEYSTPAGDTRFLTVTISPVPAADGSLLGAACMITDLSTLENIRREQELHGELSAEMALQLRTSLTTISGYAQQLANSRDPELAKQMASDIAHEAAQLDRSLGSFLTEKQARQRAAAGANTSS
jgi:nitrogen fixation/metabolism regulation signal transduction histidine kinase